MSRILRSSLALAGMTTGGVAGWIVGLRCAERRKNRALDAAQTEASLNRFAVMDMAFEKSVLKNAIKDSKNYFDLLTALAAVGFAAAHEKGRPTEEVKGKLMVHIAGVGYQFLPPEVLESIEKLVQHPLSVRDALAAGQQFSETYRQFFEETTSGMITVFGTKPENAPDTEI
jgi:hypothetical protein